MRRITAAVIVGALSIASATVSGQTDSLGHIEPGTQASVVLRNGGVFFPATVLRTTVDRLEFSTRCHGCTPDMVVSLSDVARIKVPSGRAHGVRAAFAGAGLGLLTGTVAAAITLVASPTCTEACGAEYWSFPLLGAAGLLGGTVTGLIVGTRQWRQIWPGSR